MHIDIKPKKITTGVLQELEARKLIMRLSPPQNIVHHTMQDAVEPLYQSAEESGAHSLVCVRKNQSKVTFVWHPENEEVIFLNHSAQKFKPLYLIIGLCSVVQFEKKAQRGTLTADDIMALKIEFNNPHTSVFTLCKNVPHCEVTLSGADREPPIFYVTEPARMHMHTVNVGNFVFSLEEMPLPV